MSTKISEKTSVPINWFFSALLFAIGGAWATAFYVAGVNTDIHELKLGIRQIKKKLNIEDNEEIQASSPTPKAHYITMTQDGVLIENAEAAHR